LGRINPLDRRLIFAESFGGCQEADFLKTTWRTVSHCPSRRAMCMRRKPSPIEFLISQKIQKIIKKQDNIKIYDARNLLLSYYTSSSAKIVPA